ncbi:hypothetical protein [Streptomyces sp. NBC_00083]|uniref:hypothetical protein n=1 Tax=Streptomyces sp. NBC_00083 TaxID=2975647 RepID=UPI00225BE219|nr:hypothetical protein [Streptomyces sp. NBC_00083]MCX5387235.1 hypothetical protein [Streptomyces sp. NBC_00083]
MHHILCGLAANPALPSHLVDRLIAVADGDLAPALAAREDLSRAQARALAARGEECAVQLAHAGRLAVEDIDSVAHPDVALALLDNGVGAPEWARRLVVEPDAERRERLAACPDLPSDVTERLAADPVVTVVAELALWSRASDVVAELVRHPHTAVRRAAAANEATPPDLLAALLTDGGVPPAARCEVCEREQIPFVHDRHCPRLDCTLPGGARCDGTHESAAHAVHAAALGNPATPAGAVAPFADHDSMVLRWTVARRPGLPSEVYERLAADPVPGVRADLAENPAVGEQVLRALGADQDSDVRRRVARNPSVPLDVLSDLAAAMRKGGAPLPRIDAATPTETERLARSPLPAVRALVARRRDLPAALRDALAADSDAGVVAAVAPHPGLRPAQLRAILDRHGVRVAAQVAANPDITSELLDDLAGRRPPARKALRAIAGHPRATPAALLVCLSDERARRTAAGHPALPPGAISHLLTDDDWQVVEAAAANPSLPGDVMAAMAKAASMPDEDIRRR